ncbi:hypothetical protein [Yinghuangia sp. YIM S09857]|uniref:hypothetical protein n=1 Tax=Yinghuangia sp. YIM S09857 TaxID=3436929 RepID=UPI003F53227E
MRLRARFAVAAVLLPLFAATAACDLNPNKKEKTEEKPPSDAASSPAAGGSAGGVPSPVKPSPRTALTAAELKAALVTTVKGWQVMTNDRETNAMSTEKADNPDCQPLLDLVAPVPEMQPDATANVTLSKSGAPGQINLGLAQFAPGKAEKLFTDAAAALPKCGQFTGTNANGSRIDYTAAGTGGASLGDATLRIEFTRAQGARKSTFAMVMVRSRTAAIQAMSIDFVQPGKTTPPLAISDELLTMQLDKLAEAQRNLG